MSESFDAPLSSGGAAAPERTGLVWVVDDDDVRESLSFALRPRFEIEAFPSLAAFLKGADVSTPGCLVIADSMAAIGSRTVLEELAQLKSPVSVVFLSEETDVRTAVEMLQSGAVSVLEKPVDPEELSRDVERALERSTRLERRYRLGALFESLSRRERQIFVLVCQGLKNCDIAMLLKLSQRTVEVHRAHINRKLGNAAPIRLLYELAQTSRDNIIEAPFDDLDVDAIREAISSETPAA